MEIMLIEHFLHLFQFFLHFFSPISKHYRSHLKIPGWLTSNVMWGILGKVSIKVMEIMLMQQLCQQSIKAHEPLVLSILGILNNITIQFDYPNDQNSTFMVTTIKDWKYLVINLTSWISWSISKDGWHIQMQLLIWRAFLCYHSYQIILLLNGLAQDYTIVWYIFGKLRSSAF